jgi:riboflavin synthase
MFTGIIEAVGTLTRCDRSPAGSRLSVSVPGDWELKTGESVAVNGICLTVTEHRRGEASFDAAAATMEKTTLGSWRPSTPVNLERALRPDSRLGGHWVCGHVEGVARLLGRRSSGQAFFWLLEAPAALASRIVPEGSVALDGTSLTVASARGTVFEVCLIPQTLKDTILGSRREGGLLNLETDILSKYASGARPSRITEDFLREHGFL